MTTLRETIAANIAESEANLEKSIAAEKARIQALKDELASMEATASNFLEREVGELQVWMQSLANHVFSRGKADVPVAAEVAASAEVVAAAE